MKLPRNRRRKDPPTTESLKVYDGLSSIHTRTGIERFDTRLLGLKENTFSLNTQGQNSLTKLNEGFGQEDKIGVWIFLFFSFSLKGIRKQKD